MFPLDYIFCFELRIFLICSLDTDVEELREQESVSRILAELLENWEDFFDTEDDLSTSNDYSSINEQVHMHGYSHQTCLQSQSILIHSSMSFLSLFTPRSGCNVMTLC